ncbi:MAG: ribonuclease HI [Polyangiaceae bacterium]|nr:ribonuclease HI [Polyangiaceae bacterium]
MPWVRALLRGQKVFARADEAGRLVADGGRVEVRYKPNDGRKYGAREDNLSVIAGEVLPDDACGPAETVEKKETSAKTTKAGGAASTSEERKAAAKAAHENAPPPPAGQVIAYADGACTGNPGPAGLGVMIVDGPRRIELSEYLGEGTNNIAELTAILRAVGEVPAETPMTVYTDSQYAIGVLQKGWKAKANQELVASVKRALSERKKTKLVYVPGHSGVSGNERADELAREAIRSRRKTRRETGGEASA